MQLRSMLPALLLLSSPASSQIVSIQGSDTPPVIDGNSVEGDRNYEAPYFPLVGFKNFSGNPIMKPNPANGWESRYLYNPSAIVVDDRIFLIYRAQNDSLTSSIGLAWSSDGTSFTRYSNPILTPSESYETPGGCEDPRVIRVDGTFYMTYTGYDGEKARLCIATSTDLVHWEKHGPVLPDINDVWYDHSSPINSFLPRTGWSKSGCIMAEKQADGLYHMLFGDSYLYSAKSPDLLHWNYTVDGAPYAPSILPWEKGLMECGPPAIMTRDGKWIQIYNGVAVGLGGYKTKQYSTGELLLDPVSKPDGPPIARVEEPLLQPGSSDELTGQVDDVVFTEGLVQYHGEWFMYFGQSDTTLGVAIAPKQ
ncbi:protein of unknown function (DUF377) [Geosmithia morbida]|uniref:Uncharacterized protein n=1 Tax=Geosmithia morbida TaxID=1094350 RepID=A0A9P4Z1B3_9HYPO|nr:protein of unknown function (DUF377) [Geosmithia morbida]KAF4125458.1 protein of unknown function (DUF377) [Geosmithia morbida]